MTKKELLDKKAKLIRNINVLKQDIEVAEKLICQREDELNHLNTQLKKVNSRVNQGEFYYYLLFKNDISTATGVESGDITDDDRASHNNYYFEKAVAQNRADRIKLDFEIDKWQRENDPGFAPDWNDRDQGKYSFSYNHITNMLAVDAFTRMQSQGYFFSSKNVVENFINDLGDEVKRVMFGVVGL